MHPNVSNGEIGVGRRPVRALQSRLFAVLWGAAVVVASAGWFYFIFRIAWYVVGPIFQ